MMKKNNNRLIIVMLALVAPILANAAPDLDHESEQGSGRLGVVFVQNGKPVAMDGAVDYSTVRVANKPFTILVPNSESRRLLCIHSSPFIFVHNPLTCSIYPKAQHKGLFVDNRSGDFAAATTVGKYYTAVRMDLRGRKEVPGDVYVNLVDFRSIQGAVDQESAKFAVVFPRVGAQPARTEEEIQPVFERYSGAFYRAYNKALRRNPKLQGKVILKVTILPSGEVGEAGLASEGIDDTALKNSILAVVQRMNFGPKKGPPVTIKYPIQFVPAE